MPEEGMEQEAEGYPRTTIMVSKNVAAELSRVAKNRGKTLFYVATEGLKLVSELVKDGFEPRDLLYFWRLYKILSTMDVIPIPMKLIEEVCITITKTLMSVSVDNRVPSDLREEASKALNLLWDTYEKYGHQVAALIKMEFGNLEELLETVSRLTRLLAVRYVEVRKLDNNTIELMAIGPSGTTDIGNKALMAFIRGFVSEYDYEVVQEELRANVLRVVLRRRA